MSIAQRFDRAVKYIQALPPRDSGDASVQLCELFVCLFVCVFLFFHFVCFLFTLLGSRFVLAKEQMLLFYGLYKQATLGNNNSAKPGWLDPVGRAKWNAWYVHHDKEPAEAMRECK